MGEEEELVVHRPPPPLEQQQEEEEGEDSGGCPLLPVSRGEGRGGGGLTSRAVSTTSRTSTATSSVLMWLSSCPKHSTTSPREAASDSRISFADFNGPRTRAIFTHKKVTCHSRLNP